MMTIAPILALMLAAQQTQTVPLWSAGAPGFESRRHEPEEARDYWVKNIHNPSITAFPPPGDKANGAAVVICPGGGHRMLVHGAEGVDAARRLNSIGVAAFVLKYRLGREEGSPYKIEVHARQDGLRAMRLVRSRAAEWDVDPNRVGVMGFSAGGEVASFVAFGPNDGEPKAEDPVDRLSARPDFLIQVYPGPIGLPESVAKDAPPAFLLVAADDKGASGTILKMLQEYHDAGAPVEAHILSTGGHGFNLGGRSKSAAVQHWPDRLDDWLADGGFLGAASEQ